MRGMRLPLTFAFVMLALLSLINVSAYKQANIKDPASLTVTATNSAALALSDVTGTNSPNQVTYSNGVMRINFGNGYGGVARSLQTARTQATVSVAADDLKMMSVFKITNNSADCQDVSVYVVTPPAGSNLTEIRGRPQGGTWQADTQLAGSNGAKGASTFKLGNSTSGKNVMLVDFHWVATNTVSSTSHSFTVEVSSTKGTCPP